MEFIQEDFEYKDLYSECSFLNDVVDFYAPLVHQRNIKDSLSHFSQLTNNEIRLNSLLVEEHPPFLKKYDHWGSESSEIKTHEAWSKLHEAAAVHKLVALGYNDENAEFSRFHQFLKILIFHPSSAFYSCPLAMTDGAAKALQKYPNNIHFKNVYDHLISEDPLEFWTAGQWMTERSGGSDVSNSETSAKPNGLTYKLYGTKWFTSAVTSEVAMALAKVEGSESLSLFLIKVRDAKGNLKDIEVLRLKEKLGTKAMPTAELKLKGCEGFLVGKEGRGVKEISTILNISRLYNSVCATGSVYRLQSLASDYSKKRMAFGKLIAEHPLHKKTLMEQNAKVNACVLLVSYLAVMLGKQEKGLSTDGEDFMLRFLTPVAKLWTAKKSIEITSELLESFGGVGYIEDSGLPKFLRDAQVFSIWEGTTNVLSLDVLRVITGEKKIDIALQVFEALLNQNLSSFESEVDKLKITLTSLKTWLARNRESREELELGCREFSIKAAEIFCGIKMIEFASHTKHPRDQKSARAFIGLIDPPKI